jgi:hypothetical protein
MPDDKFRDQTDGDPTTEYEDTQAHGRTGLRVGDNTEKTERRPHQPADLLPKGDY